jgi:hypothetical protein
MRPETLKQLQSVVGNTLEQIDIGNNFLKHRELKSSTSKRKKEQMGINIKTFCTAKETSPASRDCPQNRRKSLPAIHLVRD